MIPNDIRFSKKRYEKNDSIAKQVCREFFEQIGCQDIQENLNEAKRKFNELYMSDLLHVMRNQSVDILTHTKVHPTAF